TRQLNAFCVRKWQREDNERAGRCDCDGEREGFGPNTTGDRGSKTGRRHIRAALIRLQAGVGQWESRAATANISGCAFGKDRRPDTWTTNHQIVRYEVRPAWRRSDFNLGNAHAGLRSVLPCDWTTIRTARFSSDTN